MPLARAPDAATTAEAPKRLGSRYKILGMLGAGAMGTVTARAISSSTRWSPSRSCVARTFDIGDDGGDRFLTMEYVEERCSGRSSRVRAVSLLLSSSGSRSTSAPVSPPRTP